MFADLFKMEVCFFHVREGSCSRRFGEIREGSRRKERVLTAVHEQERSLVDDLEALPSSAVIRKINEVVKRARAARIHALLMGR